MIAELVLMPDEQAIKKPLRRLFRGVILIILCCHRCHRRFEWAEFLFLFLFCLCSFETNNGGHCRFCYEVGNCRRFVIFISAPPAYRQRLFIIFIDGHQLSTVYKAKPVPIMKKLIKTMSYRITPVYNYRQLD